MGKYSIEQEEEQYKVSYIDLDEGIDDLVAITYHKIHAKIIVDAFNAFHERVLTTATEVE